MGVSAYADEDSRTLCVVGIVRDTALSGIENGVTTTSADASTHRVVASKFCGRDPTTLLTKKDAEQLVKNASSVARVQATASAVQAALTANKDAMVLLLNMDRMQSQE